MRSETGLQAIRHETKISLVARLCSYLSLPSWPACRSCRFFPMSPAKWTIGSRSQYNQDGPMGMLHSLLYPSSIDASKERGKKAHATRRLLASQQLTRMRPPCRKTRITSFRVCVMGTGENLASLQASVWRQSLAGWSSQGSNTCPGFRCPERKANRKNKVILLE